MTNKQKIYLSVFFWALIILGVTGWYFLAKQPVEHTLPTENLLTKVEVSLTPEQRQTIENKITELQKQLDPQNKNDAEQIYLSLGINYEMLGELGQAKDAYLAASKINPQSSIPYGNLGTLLIQMNGLQTAKYYFEQALIVEPGSYATWQKWLEFNRYQLKQSVDQMKQLYTESFKATGSEINLHKQYARYLEDVADYQGAIKEWDVVLAMNPLDKNAVSEATRLRNKYQRE